MIIVSWYFDAKEKNKKARSCEPVADSGAGGGGGHKNGYMKFVSIGATQPNFRILYCVYISLGNQFDPGKYFC